MVFATNCATRIKETGKISFFQLKKLDCRKHAPNIPNA